MKRGNLVRAIGILPTKGAGPIPVGKIPDGATQLIAYEAAGGITVVNATVTDDTTLYLQSVALSGTNTNASPRSVGLFVRNATDVLQYYFWQRWLFQNEAFAVSMSFPTPIEIPEKWDICTEASGSDCTGYGFVFGYEV